jgi:hypothetical protein
MKAVILTLLLAALAVSGSGALGLAILAPLHRQTEAVSEVKLPRDTTPVEQQQPLDWASRSPFRRSRTPAPQPFDVRRTAATLEQVAQAPRPRLVLRGFVVGARRAAVIEGLPGIEGARVLRPGDEEAGVRVARIDGDRVVVRMKDTSWSLRVGEPGS